MFAHGGTRAGRDREVAVGQGWLAGAPQEGRTGRGRE